MKYTNKAKLINELKSSFNCKTIKDVDKEFVEAYDQVDYSDQLEWMQDILENSWCQFKLDELDSVWCIAYIKNEMWDIIFLWEFTLFPLSYKELEDNINLIESNLASKLNIFWYIQEHLVWLVDYDEQKKEAIEIVNYLINKYDMKYI